MSVTWLVLKKCTLPKIRLRPCKGFSGMYAKRKQTMKK